MVILVFLMLSIITSCNYCPTKFYTRATAPVCSLSLCSPTLLSFHSCLELINSFCKPINFGFKGDYALNPPSVKYFFLYSSCRLSSLFKEFQGSAAEAYF